jgi:hypothetical protein
LRSREGAGVAIAALADITEEAWTQRIDINPGGVFLILAQHMTGNIEGERT